MFTAGTLPTAAARAPGSRPICDAPPMLSLDGVSKAYGPRVVLRSVSLIVPDDARIGVVGPNGIGKLTLLRVMAGAEAPDEGRILRAPPALRVGLLDQRGRPADDETVAEHLARRTGVAAAEERLDALTAALADEPDRVEEYSEALESFLALGGDDLAGPRRRRPHRRGSVARPARPADGRPLGRPGGAGRPGRPRARPPRRAPARRAHQRPRLLRPRDPGAPRGRPSRCRGHGLARPRLPRPLRAPDGRGGRALARGARVRRRLDRLRRPARPGARAPVRGARPLRRGARAARGPDAPSAGMVGGGCQEGEEAAEGPRQDRPRDARRALGAAGLEGPRHRARARAPRRGRQALGGLAPAVAARLGARGRGRRRRPRGRRRRAGRLPPRAGRSRRAPRRPPGDHRAQRRRQEHPDRRPARPDPARRRAPAAPARRSWWARSSRSARPSSAHRACWTR